jgi:hypothetical protein
LVAVEPEKASELAKHKKEGGKVRPRSTRRKGGIRTARRFVEFWR